MFDDVVDRYDLLNDLLSLGLDRRWRRRAAGAIRVHPRDRVLDLGCGTGRLGMAVSSRARVVGVDVSFGMLSRARRDSGGALRLVQGSAFRLPFADEAFAAAVSGFVLRNLNDLGAAFEELFRVLAPGATIALIDATEPANPYFRRLFDAYFRTVAPALGAVVGRRAAYRYLAGSLAQIPSPGEMCRLLADAGFTRCRAQPLTGGMVTLFTAVRAAGRSEREAGG
jgi:demethylmenaquinone methyltransferase / 2-methoxy-6-polyprenyl-1,4-benzoquinol methylase